MAMWKKILLGLLVLAAVIFIIFKLTAKKTTPKTEPVVRKDLEVTIDVSGKVKADRFASLSFSTLGQLEKIASAGAEMAENETLAQVKSNDYYAALQQAYASLNKTTSTFYYYLEVKGETDKTYLGDDDISRAKRNEARVNAEGAAAGVDVAKFALNQSLATLAKTAIRAPFKGVVGRTYLKVGETATPGVAVMDFFDPGSFYFEVEADEIDVNALKINLPVKIKLDAFGEQQFNGEITSIDPGSHITSSGGTAYYVRIGFQSDPVSQASQRLRTGLNGEAKIVKETKPGVLIVSSSAVSSLGGKSYVEVLVNGKERLKREVTLGELVDNAYEVLSGVSEGEQVVIP